MESSSIRIWMIRSGAGGYLIEEFLSNNIIAIGWNELGQISDSIDYAQLKEIFKAVYPDDKVGRVNQSVSQIWKFIKEIRIGDKVVTYDSGTRQYYLGEIISNYKFNAEYEFQHYR